MSLRGGIQEMEGGKVPPETPMLVEMGKSGTPALLLCEPLLPALAQRLDLLSPMHARAGRIMLARRKRKEEKNPMSTKPETQRLILAAPFYFIFLILFFSPSFFLLDQPCADGGGAVLVPYLSTVPVVDFFLCSPPDPPAHRNLFVLLFLLS